LNIFLLDPYSDEHLEKIIVFEKENNCLDKLSSYIEKIRETISKEDYYDHNKNEFNGILFTEKNNKITDCCYIYGEKDIKQCKITPININNKNKRRQLPELATDYAVDKLGMVEIFINVDKDDNNMIMYLESKGYENIGEVSENILLLKEIEEKENGQRMISWI